MLALRTIFRMTGLCRRPSFLPLNFTQMSSLKQKTKSIKVQKQNSNKTDIVSLLSDQLEQLANLTHYSTSVNYLQKNEIQKSYEHLQFSLTEARAKFTQSVNLHIFLLNRMSILQKILGMQGQFLNSLEEIFFMSLSLKGDKNLDVLKHLHNYMIELIISDPEKLNSLVEFLHESNFKMLLKKSEYFLAINKFFNNEKAQAIREMENLQEEGSHKYIKTNNLSWFKLLSITNETLEMVSKEKHQQVEAIQRELISTLIEAEKNGELNARTQYIEQNIALTNALSEYLEKKNGVLLLKINWKTVLLNSQSHIIVMNLAHALYLLKKNEEAAIFMKMALESSIQIQEPYRLGLGLALLSKIHHRSKLEWQPVLLSLLTHKNLYSPAAIRQCLRVYSRILFIERRYYQAEAYAIQAENIKNANLYVQGLILPDFDFSF